MKALKNCIRFLLPFFILQLLHFKYISILPDTAFMFVYRLPSHSTSFLDVCAQWLLPISAILYFSVYDTDFLYYFGGFIIPRLKSRNTLIIKLHLSGIILGFITCSIYFCGNVLLYFECFMQNSVTIIMHLFGTFLNLYLLFQWVLLLRLWVSETTTILFLSIYCLISECMVFVHPFRIIAYLIFPWYCTPTIKIIFIMMLYFLLYLQIKRKDFV